MRVGIACRATERDALKFVCPRARVRVNARRRLVIIVIFASRKVRYDDDERTVFMANERPARSKERKCRGEDYRGNTRDALGL